MSEDWGVFQTPFWRVDNRDFMLNGEEWDIKNNFIYHEGACLNNNYTHLPALIPNRFSDDQWSKRNFQSIPGKNGVVFLFTYLKGSDLINNQRGQDFLEINLSDQQEEFIKELNTKYGGHSQSKEPFSEEKFWEKMNEIGTLPLYTLNSRPHLIITGYASKNHWNLFKNTGPGEAENVFQKNQVFPWYTINTKGTCNFLNGTLWTKITNATVPVAELPSFLSLHPQLRINIKEGRLKY